MRNLYIEDCESVKKDIENLTVPFEPQCQEYENVCALPPVSIGGKGSAVYQGGIFDMDFNCVEGISNDMSLFRGGYQVSAAKLPVFEADAVFGGFFYKHFGIMLLLSLKRLWWLIENREDSRKIIFLCEKREPSSKYFCSEIMKLLGIDSSKYLIVEDPTRFSKILIPDEAPAFYKLWSDKFFMPFREINDRLLRKYPEKTPAKVYFSRSRFIKPGRNPDGINEEYYEDFYRRRGFEIVFPEQLPLEQQIRLIAGADEFVSTFGTLANFGTLFLKENADQTMLQRAESHDNWFRIQMNLISRRNLQWSLISATKNPYPTHHDGGVFFYFPTEQFRKYLDERGITYNEDELKYEATSEQLSEYIRRWLCIYSSPKGFKFLNKPEIFPIMQALYFQATGILLDPKDYI